MTVISLWAGSAGQKSITIKAKASAGATSVDFLVGTTPDLDGAPILGTAVPDANDMVTLTVTDLDPNTRYYYAVDEDETFDAGVDPIGTFLTHRVTAGNPLSFTFAVGGCAGAGPPAFPGGGAELDPVHVSDHPVFDEIAQRGIQENWLFFAHTGDFHYYNIGTDKTASLTTYRRAIDDVLLQENQQSLYKSLPLVYGWDDHDFDGNNSDGTYVSKSMPQQVYREKVPSYPLPDANAIYHSFEIGRVLFIVSDVRSDRSPDSNPDGPSKTMLGAAQKVWMEDVLSNSNAEAFVWITQQAWLNGAGAWVNYATEVAELVQMFTDTGFVNRMMVVTGDSHYFAIDNGTHTPGNMPMMVANHLDSSIGGSAFPFSEGSVINLKGQYATVEFNDDGDTIDVVFRGWRESVENPIKTFSFTVGVSAIPPPPGPEPEPEPPLFLPVGISRPTVEWLSVDFVTGQMIAELPDVLGPFGRLVGAYTTTELQLPIPASGPGAIGPIALQATVPGRTMLVAVVNDQPVWGGRVTRRHGGTPGMLRLSCTTTEGYFRRRRVQDHTFSQVDEAKIMAALIGDAGNRDIEGLGLVGGIGLEIDAPSVSLLRDDSYLHSDRATVYDRLRERSARSGGLEWTVDLFWANDEHTAIRKVARVAPRIGIAASAPEAVFETAEPAAVLESLGANEATYDYDEDYSESRGATWVEAYAPGEGEEQPGSDPAIATGKIAGGWPIDEYHWQPSSSITNVDVLNGHATRELALRQNGANLWTISARWDVFPRLNIDWRMGDDIAWHLFGHRHPPVFDANGTVIGGGAAGKGHCIGWDLDSEAGIVRPILLDPLSEGEFA